jgi:hypothetical protein
MSPSQMNPQPNTPLLLSSDLDIIGAGTPQCESLSSYVQRLSALHSILPGQLIFRCLTWVERRCPEMIGSRARRSGRLILGRNINGYSTAISWLKILQQMSGKADLDHLTTIAWDRLFPTRGFQRLESAWCPQCLREDAVPYHRLAWMLQSVKICTAHKLPLSTRCPKCGKKIPVLHERSTISTCSKCGRSLCDSLQSPSIENVNAYDLWTAREVGNIIANSAEWHSPLSWSPSATLNLLKTQRRLSRLSDLCEFLGTSKITTWYWLSGEAKPSLPSSLHICYRFGVSLSSILANRPVKTVGIMEDSQAEFYLGKTRNAVKRDWVAIKRLLVQESKKPQHLAKSLTAVAIQAGVAARAIRAHFPQLCCQIARKAAARRSSESKQREAELQQKMEAAVHQLHQARETATQGRIAALLKRPGLFSRHNARAILQRIEAQFEQGK